MASTTSAGTAGRAGQARRQTRRRVSLSFRLTLLVLLAALLPVAAVVGINVYLSRGTLLDQGQRSLSTDAKAKVSLIDTYMQERAADGQTLASVPTGQLYIFCLGALQSVQSLPYAQAQALRAICSDENVASFSDSSLRALKAGMVRDNRYTQWTLFSATGKPIQSSVGAVDKVQPVPDEDLKIVGQNKQAFSGVRFDKASNAAYLNIYTPIVTPDLVIQKLGGQPQVLGMLQATIKLDYIWSIVDGEKGANGTGSTAFITDENGVRIADVNPANRFSAVKQLDPATQQLIANEQRFGTNVGPLVQDLPDIATSLGRDAQEDAFQGVAFSGDATKYQVDRIHMRNVPWSYFVLSPVSTVTAVADAQVRTALISAGIIAVLAILIGLLFARPTASSVRSAVVEVEGAAVSMRALAARQQSSAGEQHWVVDACKTGLESVRYLSDAMHQAAQRIVDASNWFGEYWDRLTEEQARRTVAHLNELAQYIDEAARRQQASSDRLGKAITVTMQVSDQLVAGASAASRASEQLGTVVGDLQNVVGGKHNVNLDADSYDAGDADDMALAAMNAGGQQMAPSGQRSMRPPRSIPSQPEPMGPAPRMAMAGSRRPQSSRAGSRGAAAPSQQGQWNQGGYDQGDPYGGQGGNYPALPGPGGHDPWR